MLELTNAKLWYGPSKLNCFRISAESLLIGIFRVTPRVYLHLIMNVLLTASDAMHFFGGPKVPTTYLNLIAIKLPQRVVTSL